MTVPSAPDTETPSAPSPLVANTRVVRTRRARPVRTLLSVLTILLLLGVVAGIGYTIVRGGAMQPINVVAYPNATLTETSTKPGSDHRLYISTDPFDVVGRFYAQALGTSDPQYCQQLGDPRVATDSHIVRCLVDKLTLGNEQIVRLTINTDPAQPKQTQIVIDRSWPTG